MGYATPVWNNHSRSSEICAKAINWSHTFCAGAFTTTSDRMAIGRGGRCAACSPPISSGSVRTSAPSVCVAGRDDAGREQMLCASPPPIMAMGNAMGRAITRQTAPSTANTSNEAPARTVASTATPREDPVVRAARRLYTAEERNPTTNGTPTNNPHP